jgi:uncharacterized protein YycO
MRVVLFRSRSFISRLIRWQTRSQYSHAAVLTDEGALVESVEGKGVISTANWQKPAEADVFLVWPMSTDQANTGVGFLSAQIGKPYDWLMVLRFVTRRQASRRSSGKWFCSELVFAAFQKAGIELLRDTEPWEVSPGLLARSPLLKPI